MWFVDHATISVKAGSGGNGCASFAQPPYIRFPYPDGGAGGDGGDIIIISDLNIATLLDFHFKHEFKAGRGGHGGSNKKSGKRGADLIIRVPVGTVVRDIDSKKLMRDLSKAGEELVVANGGRGGLGNAIAKEATDGRPGEHRRINFELKLIADVGIVGFPNAGKSSFLSRISTARPKIGSYPFTTRYPVLGVVQLGERSPFVACDIPGLIEDAHKGRGLGIQFLRHIERTKLLVHLIDMASVDGRSPIDAYSNLNKELASYSEELPRKVQIIAANKMDLPQAKKNLASFKQNLKKAVWPISCATGQGIPALLDAICDELNSLHSK